MTEFRFNFWPIIDRKKRRVGELEFWHWRKSLHVKDKHGKALSVVWYQTAVFEGRESYNGRLLLPALSHPHPEMAGGGAERAGCRIALNCRCWLSLMQKVYEKMEVGIISQTSPSLSSPWSITEDLIWRIITMSKGDKWDCEFRWWSTNLLTLGLDECYVAIKLSTPSPTNSQNQIQNYLWCKWTQRSCFDLAAEFNWEGIGKASCFLDRAQSGACWIP